MIRCSVIQVIIIIPLFCLKVPYYRSSLGPHIQMAGQSIIPDVESTIMELFSNNIKT